MKKNDLTKSIIFLIVSIIIFISVGIFTDKINLAVGKFISILINIIPVLIIVWIVMVVTDYFITPKEMVMFMKKNKGIKGWVIAVVAGLISVGAMYMWYPLLKKIKEQGITNDIITIFLYNRAIKLQLLPMMLYYFGVTYTIVLTIVMIFVSVVNGITVQKILDVL